MWQDLRSTGPEASRGREGSPATATHPGKAENRADAAPLLPSAGMAQPRLPGAGKSRSAGDAARAAGTTALAARLALTGVK